ncbi:GNAT family N-acetyltransferase [Bacillus sp. JJ722]|uniref:GNAT family N-acetyltransferase n=1 Tax=Bacillus sp. JJ722 TaxID=3122973 RepID=UPI003000019A
MTLKFAEEILNWQYEAPYDFYNNDVNADSLKDLLQNPYVPIVDENEELVGFYCIGKSAQVPIGVTMGAYSADLIDIGIGMNPELTGKGYGSMFFSFILRLVQKECNLPIRLTVAKFNRRAIHLYEKFGFVKEMEFSQETTKFITMVKS